MKIAFNPSTVEALTTPPNNKDITFDLRGHNIFARGVKFCGTDTNTWRDIKINNVSIDSNTLDLRDGSNTTLTNINGVVTINSTWRPVVDNLTSDSTTSSLSANQGRVLKALIDGKSDSEHNHDDRYLRLTGGTLTGDLYINTNLYGPVRGNNPRNRYDAALYFFNCNSSTTSTYNFGLYQWNDEFQFTYRTSADNLWKGNSFTIQGSDGQVTFDKTPKVGSALISLNGHTHAYLPLSGGWMSGDINFGGDNKIYWGRNTDSASISFKNDGDGDDDSYMSFVTSDNGNEYFRWSHSSGSTNTEWMALRSDGLRVGGTKVSLEGHSHNDLYYTKTEVNNKLNDKSDSEHNHDDRYVKKTGDTMFGALNFANGTWNLVGDDSYMGDCNISGHFGIKAANTTYPGISFFNNANAHLGNLTAYSGNIKYGAYSLQFLDNGNTNVSAGTWMNPFNTYNASAVADGQAICVWGQSSYLSNLAADSGDMSLWLKRVNSNVATLNMVLDGEYYANGNQRLAHVSEIPNSLKNPYALTISLNGTSQGPYDGSAAKNINITPSSIGAATSDHNHDGRYVRYYAVTTLDCNNLAVGLTAAGVSATNASHTNHSAFLYISDVGTPFQIQIPDSSVPYIYKRYYSSGGWSGWFKLNAGYADSAGSVAWDNVTGKPSSFTPSSHTHSWTSITDKLVAGNEFNIVNAGFNGEIWFNYLPINDRNETATINRYHFGNGAAGYTSIKASGFVKNGSSSSYVLLGDGGHQTISSLSVNYANSAGSASNLTVHQYLSDTDTTWWPLIWGGSSHNNTSDSTGEVYKSHDVLSWQTSSQTLYATHLRTTDLNTQTALFHPGDDSTLKIYSGRTQDAVSDGHIGLQTSIDNTDGQTHAYPTQYGSRCVLALQPRGGSVYIGNMPNGGNGCKLNVNGDIGLLNTGSIRDLTIGGGIYWNPYVESASDNTDAASITVVKSGVAGGTTLVLSQMNDANDTIQFQTNGSARLYHNSYPILTTQNTYVSNNKGYINGTEITQVNNADTVDGYHETAFPRLVGIKGNNWNWNDVIRAGYYKIQEGTITNHPYGIYPFGMAEVITTENHNDGENRELQIYYPHHQTNNIAIWLRMHNGSTQGNGWGSWVGVPNTNGNIASATKLQTPRTIWGQSFDGTADVNGTIYINNNNSSEGAIRLNNNINSNARISAIDSQVIFNTGNAIRFGETDWDWNQWAGLKYTHSNKTIYLGIADGSVFNANSVQSGGTLNLRAGIRDIDLNSGTSIRGLPTNGSPYSSRIALYDTSISLSAYGGISMSTGPGAIELSSGYGGIKLSCQGNNASIDSEGFKVEASRGVYLNSGNSGNVYLCQGGKVGIGTTAPAYKLDVVGNIRATGQIIREGSGQTWVNGRNGALLRETSVAGYHTLWSLKTTNGSWDFGEYNAGNDWDNIPVLSYITDSNYNSGNNTPTYQIRFPLASGTVALTSNIPNPNNYYWANVKISTSSSTTTSPTVSNLTATNSIKMGNILLEHTDEINNSTNGWLHLNYRNSGNISLCYGGGTVSIGTVDASYKLSVMGNTCTKGFIIRPCYLSIISVTLSNISPGDGYVYRCLEIGSSAEISCIIADKVALSNERGVLIKFNTGYDGQIVLLKDLQNYGDINGNGYFWVMPSGCKIIRPDGSSTQINYNQISNAYDDGKSRFFVYSFKYNAWIEFYCS